jgi:hypothetical protein
MDGLSHVPGVDDATDRRREEILAGALHLLGTRSALMDGVVQQNGTVTEIKLTEWHRNEVTAAVLLARHVIDAVDAAMVEEMREQEEVADIISSPLQLADIYADTE